MQCIAMLFTLAVTFSTILSVVSGGAYSESFDIVEIDGCTTIIRHFNPLIHKQKYLVGVYSTQGTDVVTQLYNKVFSTYLTETAGKRFNPSIEFEVIPVNQGSLMEKADSKEVDFFFASSSVFSCMATEKKAQALATIISKREVRGHEFELDVYGGVMFTLADNDRVNSIQDFKDKTIGAGGITMMGGGQSQFYEMFAEGLSYVADPLQVTFTTDERLTVQGVLDGDFEIGFARTDQIERHLTSTGEHLDPDVFKVINPQIHILDNGKLFPFLSSTGLNPEWPLAALDHTARDVSLEVQDALLALRDHATTLVRNESLRCDTTPSLAQLATEATEEALLVGFRTARSYFEVRTKQEAAGFMRENDKGELKCITGATLYHDIQCPADHYKLTEEEFHKSCTTAGMPCKEGYQCFCKPCIKAFEVDVFQYFPSNETSAAELAQMASDLACKKMSVCGRVEQTKTLHLRLIDNRKREDPEVEIIMHHDFDTVRLPVERVPGTSNHYDITWSYPYTGMEVLEVYFDGEQIPQSPVRIQVVERQCDVDFPGQKRTNSESGTCACGDASMEINGKCVESTVVAVVISLTAVLLLSMLGIWYVQYRTKKQDELWQITVDELQFDDPPEVIGQGSFGVVLLARYRGTTVALKRAIKVSSSRHGSKRSKAIGYSRGESRTRGTNKGDSSIGMSSGGASSSDNQDLETGVLRSDDRSSDFSNQEPSIPSGSGHSGRYNNSGYRSSGQGSYVTQSLGFLVSDFEDRSKWAWLFPWAKRDDYHSRFKNAILGASGSESMSTKTWHACLCPWFNAQVRAREEFISEMRVLSRLRHPSITTVLGAVLSRSHDPMLVMEYMEYGSLHDLLRNETMYLSGEIILQISRDVSQGLRFLHSSRPPILHGDMKARNILVDSRFRAKLCDFGMSTKTSGRIHGTPYWLAPEYLRGQTRYTASCDIYSVGIILYEIYSRQDPYKGEDFRDTLRKVCDRRVNKRPTIPPNTPPKMVEMMKKCWSPDAVVRPEAKDLDTAFLDWTIGDVEPLSPSDQLNAQKEKRTGDMLYELFPKHVADQLKNGQKVEAEQHDEVTVVFSDIVHFTDISRLLSAMKVSQMLDRLYLAFDRVARKNEVFKVETIGDAYMGVTNLEKQQMDTHAKQAALFAIDLVNEASKILIDEEDPSKGYVNVRVGFHSGPVVSNVIGSLNPRYGLFGDTVNTSSRMESNSKANRILCSDAAYKILHEQAPEISSRKRGKIAVKGKGDMVVWWIGDEELKGRDRNSPNIGQQPQELEMEKRVGFHDQEETEHSHSNAVAVPDHVWRRDLQTKLTKDMDDDKEYLKQQTVSPPKDAVPSEIRASSNKSVLPPEQAPQKKNTLPQSAGSQRHAKEVIRYKRSFDD